LPQAQDSSPGENAHRWFRRIGRLGDAESRSDKRLLRTISSDLVNAAGHALYLIDRSGYDRTITPINYDDAGIEMDRSRKREALGQRSVL